MLLRRLVASVIRSLCFLGIVVLAFWLGYSQTPRSDAPSVGGDETMGDAQANPVARPIAVMIDNHVDARPPAGIEEADVVYESIAEGGITRLLAIFLDPPQTKKIGPVRSARPFFVALAEEWGAVYFHSGGSPEALALLAVGQLDDVNEISGDGVYFWRDPNRSAPHNLFTSSALTRRVIAQKHLASSGSYTEWPRARSAPVSGLVAHAFVLPWEHHESATAVTFDFFGTGEYEVAFRWNPATGRYTRLLGGKVHRTEQGIILGADVVVVQHTRARVVDDYGRLAVTLTGSGPVEVYQEAKKITGRWVKANGRTSFFDATGAPIAFTPGVVWVALAFDAK